MKNFSRDSLQGLRRPLQELRGRFSKVKPPKVFPIITTEIQEQQFNESCKILSQNANYILVLNGVLLSFFLITAGRGFSNATLQLANLSISTSAGSVMNVTSSQTHTILYFQILYLFTAGSFFASMIWCVGCFTTGFFPRVGQIRKKYHDLKNLEKRAMWYYSLSVFFVFLGIIGLMFYSFSPVTGPPDQVVDATIMFYIIFILLSIVAWLFGLHDRRVEKAEEDTRWQVAYN